MASSSSSPTLPNAVTLLPGSRFRAGTEACPSNDVGFGSEIDSERGETHE